MLDLIDEELLLDVGGGTTEAAVVSISGVVASRTIRIGGASLNEALIGYVRRKFNLLIGDETAERLKLVLGTAHPTDLSRKLEIRGRDLISGVPKAIEIGSEETTSALRQFLIGCQTLCPQASAGDEQGGEGKAGRETLPHGFFFGSSSTVSFTFRIAAVVAKVVNESGR